MICVVCAMGFVSVDTNIYKYARSLYFNIVLICSCEKVSCDRGYVIIMATGNSFTKFMLIVCGIVLMASVLSGCTEAGANILMDNPDDYVGKDIIKLTDDIAKNPSTTMTSSSDNHITYELTGLTIDVSLLPETATPHQIEFTDENGNSVRLTETGDPDTLIDTAEHGKNGIYPTDAPTTSEATSTQTQLGDAPSEEPTASSSDSDIDFTGMSPEEVYRAALDNPDALVGQPISLLVIDDPLIEETGLNRYSLKTKEISESFAKKHDGIYSYSMETNGVSPTSITIHSNDSLGIGIEDYDGDGVIDEIFEL